jgi:hypothetical protein
MMRIFFDEKSVEIEKVSKEVESSGRDKYSRKGEEIEWEWRKKEESDDDEVGDGNEKETSEGTEEKVKKVPKEERGAKETDEYAMKEGGFEKVNKEHDEKRSCPEEGDQCAYFLECAFLHQFLKL